MRLTEWIDNQKSRARIRNDTRDIEAFEAYTRLAEYEDICPIEKLRGVRGHDGADAG